MLQTAGSGVPSDIDKAFFSQVCSAVFDSDYINFCTEIQLSFCHTFCLKIEYM